MLSATAWPSGAAQAAVRREAWYRMQLTTIVENASDGIISFDRHGVIVSWNGGAETIFGYSAQEAIGAPSRQIVRAPPDRQGEQDQLLQAVLEGTFQTQGLFLRLRRDGSQVALSTSVFTLSEGEGIGGGFCAVVRDVTAAHEQTERLAHQNEHLRLRDEQMRALAARLDAVREEEGKRIAREVHDELGQLLTGLKMDMRWITARLAEPALIERIEECDGLVDRIIVAVQRIATEIRPSVLDAFGLQAAIRDEVRRFEARTAMAVRMSLDDRDDVPADIATAFFRIFQQILTNIVRHAGASAVTVRFWEADIAEGEKVWALDVRDDGVGFAEDPLSPSQSLGLLGMRERAALVGGAVRIETAPGEGTRVRVTVTKRKETSIP